MHWCTECGDPIEHHSERCGELDGDDACRHFPALCCPGCACGSFEEAHPSAPSGGKE